MEHLTKLDAPHHAYLLLRYCLSFSRMVFFLRAIPVDFLPRACDTFDQAVRQGLQAISCYKFDNNALIQSSLRLSNGGLGLRNSKLHHPAAYYASDGLRNKARLNAVTAPRASAIWSSSPSSKIGNGFTSDEWNVIMARNMGLKIFDEPFPCPAPGCNETMDVYGDHAILRRCKGDRTRTQR